MWCSKCIGLNINLGEMPISWSKAKSYLWVICSNIQSVLKFVSCLVKCSMIMALTSLMLMVQQPKMENLHASEQSSEIPMATSQQQ